MNACVCVCVSLALAPLCQKRGEDLLARKCFRTETHLIKLTFAPSLNVQLPWALAVTKERDFTSRLSRNGSSHLLFVGTY